MGLTRARQFPAVANMFLHERLQQGDRHLTRFIFVVALGLLPKPKSGIVTTNPPCQPG
jgi:hypothetical protein